MSDAFGNDKNILKVRLVSQARNVSKLDNWISDKFGFWMSNFRTFTALDFLMVYKKFNMHHFLIHFLSY